MRLASAALAAAAGVVVVVLIGASVLVVQSRRAADAAEDVASSRALAAASALQVESNPDLAILLGLESLARVEGRAAADTYAARNALATVLTRQPRLRRVLQVGPGAAAVDFSPEGSQLAVAGADGAVRRWTLGGDRIDRIPLRGTGSCYVRPFDIDVRWREGRVVQIGCGTARSFRPESGKEIGMLGGPSDERGEEEADAVLSPDGRTVGVTGEWSDLRLLDVDSGRVRFRRPGTQAFLPPYAEAFSADGTIVALRIPRKPSRFWNIDLGRVVGPPAPGHVLALSPGGEAAVMNRDDVAVLWDVRRGRPIARLELAGSTGAEFAADGTRVAVADREGGVHVWSLSKRWRPRGRISLDHRGVVGLRFAADGTTLASASTEGTVRLWDVGDAWPLLELLQPGNAYEVAFLRDGRRLLVQHDTGTALWEATASARRRLDGDVEGLGEAIAVSDRLVATAAQDPAEIDLWDAEAWRPQRVILAGGYLDGVALDASGELVAASDDEGVRFWDPRTGQTVLRRLPRAREPIALSSDGRLLASGGSSDAGFGDLAATQLWEVETGRRVGVSAAGGEPNDLAFAADGRLAVAEDGGVALWDADGRGFLYRARVDVGRVDDCCGVNSVAFAGDVVAATSVQFLVLRDAATGDPIGDPIRVASQNAWAVDIASATGAIAVAGTEGAFLVDPVLLAEDVDRWHRRLCPIVRRGLSSSERRRHLDGEDAATSCHPGE